MLALCGHRRTIRVDQEKLEGGKLNSIRKTFLKPFGNGSPFS